MLVRLMASLEPGSLPVGNYVAPDADANTTAVPWKPDAEPGQANHLDGAEGSPIEVTAPAAKAAPDLLSPPLAEDNTNVLAVVHEEKISWEEMQIAARMLTYSLIGTMTAAFFLSRSFVVFLYLLFGLIIGMFQMARVRWPDMAPVRLSDTVGRILLMMVGSIIFLWVLTRVLLSLS
jgi:hypothetical protein